MTETETTFFKLTLHNETDHTYREVPPPVIGERSSISELVAMALMHMRTVSVTPAQRQKIARDLATMPTAEDLPFVIEVDCFERYVIEPVGEMTHAERLTISVGRDTAKEARDALAWFQLGQQHPVTLDVEEDCLHVYLDDGSFSIGVNPSVGAEVFFKPTGEEPYEFGAVLPAGLGLDEEEQVEFYEIIDGLMGNLAGFHYLSGGAAVRAIVAEGRA